MAQQTQSDRIEPWTMSRAHDFMHAPPVNEADVEGVGKIHLQVFAETPICELAGLLSDVEGAWSIAKILDEGCLYTTLKIEAEVPE